MKMYVSANHTKGRLSLLGYEMTSACSSHAGVQRKAAVPFGSSVIDVRERHTLLLKRFSGKEHDPLISKRNFSGSD